MDTEMHKKLLTNIKKYSNLKIPYKGGQMMWEWKFKRILIVKYAQSLGKTRQLVFFFYGKYNLFFRKFISLLYLSKSFVFKKS